MKQKDEANVPVAELKEISCSDHYFQDHGERCDKNILSFEIKRMQGNGGFTEYGMTDRSEQLKKALRKIDAVLTQNANKHSKDFVEGMELVKGVKTDLSDSI